MFNPEILKIILAGTLLGLTAGISPGPLLTLVITQTLQRNRKAGIQIALSPLLTDIPVIIVTLLIFSQLAQLNSIIGIISFAGALFVAYLGYETITTKKINLENQTIGTESLRRGVITNFLSPHPYLFWLTIGAPFIFRAYKINLLTAILFLISFYIFLVGSKMFIAIIVARSKSFLNNKSYVLIMRLLGISLFIFSLLFFYDGIKRVFPNFQLHFY